MSDYNDPFHPNNNDAKIAFLFWIIVLICTVICLYYTYPETPTLQEQKAAADLKDCEICHSNDDYDARKDVEARIRGKKAARMLIRRVE